MYEALSYEELVEEARELQGYLYTGHDERLFGHLPLDDDEPEEQPNDSSDVDYYPVERIWSIQLTPITSMMRPDWLQHTRQQKGAAARLKQGTAVTAQPLPQTEWSVAAAARILARRALKEVLP